VRQLLNARRQPSLPKEKKNADNRFSSWPLAGAGKRHQFLAQGRVAVRPRFAVALEKEYHERQDLGKS
jgi:hypothetical protein